MHTELREVWNAEVGYQNSAREVRGWTWSRLEGARRCVQDLQGFGMHVERVLVWLRATMLGYRAIQSLVSWGTLLTVTV